MAGWPTPRCAESLRVNTNVRLLNLSRRGGSGRGTGDGGGGGGFPQTPALLQMTEGGRCGVQDWDQL